MTVHRTNTSTAIVAAGIGKRYGERWVLRDVDLDVPAGTVLGLLGPNGAGKTTTVRILTTLLAPDEGSARVAGFDVASEAPRVRAGSAWPARPPPSTGCSPAAATSSSSAASTSSAREAARERADELLERFGLAARGDRLVETYSGGMRRRLDLAASLVATPPVLFLDEPTTGLDPRQPQRAVGTCCASSSTTARRCCSPPSTSRRPTGSPTTSWCSTAGA